MSVCCFGGPYCGKQGPVAMPDGGVDPFSLWLTLKDEQDERVQICLDEMMKEVL